MAYRVNTGMNLHTGKRVEAGDLIGDDEPAKKSIGWLTRRGHLTHEPEPGKKDGKGKPPPDGEEG